MCHRGRSAKQHGFTRQQCIRGSNQEGGGGRRRGIQAAAQPSEIKRPNPRHPGGRPRCLQRASARARAIHRPTYFFNLLPAGFSTCSAIMPSTIANASSTLKCVRPSPESTMRCWMRSMRSSCSLRRPCGGREGRDEACSAGQTRGDTHRHCCPSFTRASCFYRRWPCASTSGALPSLPFSLCLCAYASGLSGER